MKLLLLSVISLSLAMTTQAQKVIRKGMPPVQTSKAQPTARYGIGQFTGRWQEVSRFTRTNRTAVSFTDSLQLWFKGSNVEIREGNGMSMNMKGAASIDAPNTLNVAGDSYTVLSLSKNMLVIDDGEFIRTLRKMNRFYYETLGQVQVAQPVYTTPVVTDGSALTGKWTIYRRDAAPGEVNANTNVIKNITINTVTAGNITGTITYFGKDNIAQTVPMTGTISNGEIRINTSAQNFTFNTYKAESNEFVFGHTGGLMYYAKHL